MSAVGRIGNSSGWLRSEVPLEASDGGTDVGSEGGVGGEGSGEGVEGGEGGKGGAEGGKGGSARDGGGRGGGSSGGGMSPLPSDQSGCRPPERRSGVQFAGTACGGPHVAGRQIACNWYGRFAQIFVRSVAPRHGRRAAARRSALLLTAGSLPAAIPREALALACDGRRAACTALGPRRPSRKRVG